MHKYFVNTNPQPTGEHEVHKEGCPHPPAPSNRKHLGSFTNCREAVREARKHYSNVDGCAYCVPDCHTR
ncbi:MAG: hypothetical protein ACF8R7_15915 [Phycisphaerales bacterium JB039]